MKEKIDIERYSDYKKHKPSEGKVKFRSKYDAAVRDKYADAEKIIPLVRRKKLTS